MTLISISYKSISYFGGITLKSGRRGFAVYRNGKVVAQYTAIGRLYETKRQLPNPFRGGNQQLLFRLIR